MFRLFLLLLLVSCNSTVSDNWSCPNPKGNDCTTISEADNNISANKQKQDEQPAYVLESEGPASKKVAESFPAQPNNFLYKRTKESTERVWFAPFIDADGNQHEESYVRVITAQPKWVITDEIH